MVTPLSLPDSPKDKPFFFVTYIPLLARACNRRWAQVNERVGRIGMERHGMPAFYIRRTGRSPILMGLAFYLRSEGTIRQIVPTCLLLNIFIVYTYTIFHISHFLIPLFFTRRDHGDNTALASFLPSFLPLAMVSTTPLCLCEDGWSFSTSCENRFFFSRLE